MTDFRDMVDRSASTQAFQSHVTGCMEEIRSDGADLERIDEGAIRPAVQQSFKVCLRIEGGGCGCPRRPSLLR